MEEKPLSYEESLKVIQSMITMVKSKTLLTGFHFLLWGVLAIITSLVNYYQLSNGAGNESFQIWIVTSIVGIAIGIIYEYRSSRTQSTRTHFDTLHAFLWVGFCITLALMIGICIVNKTSPTPFILTLIGLATFVSGVAYSFKPLIVGALIFWISGIFCSFFGVPEQLLINSCAILLGYIVPGLLLWKQSKRARDV